MIVIKRFRKSRVSQGMLDRAPAGSVIERSGNGQTGVARERQDALHQSFTETGLAQDHGPVVILQSPREDLGGTGRFFVDQNSQGNGVWLSRIGHAGG